MTHPRTRTFHHFIHIALVQHHSKRWRLCRGVNGSLFNGCRECSPCETNQREMVLVDTETSSVSCTCCRIEVQVTFWSVTACRRMHRSTRGGVSLIAPAPINLATLPCSSHLRHSLCSVDASMWISVAIWHKNQLVLLRWFYKGYVIWLSAGNAFVDGGLPFSPIARILWEKNKISSIIRLTEIMTRILPVLQVPSFTSCASESSTFHIIYLTQWRASTLNFA